MKSLIKLKTLEIINYRNIKYQVLNFDGDNSKIVGENRVGKTNTLEALYWLLTDRFINGSKDTEQIKPLENTKEKVTVSATFLIWDKSNPQIPPKEVTIAKEYKEDWVKTRGTEELVMQGHSTTYFHNGVKQSTKKEFDILFHEDFLLNGVEYQGIDIIQMLINPLYLGRMGDNDDWKNLRTMIIDIAGDVSDVDVIKSEPELILISEDLSRYGGRTDQLIKHYREVAKGLKEDIIGFEANIKMLSKTENPTDSDVEVARSGVEECDATIHSLKVNNGDDQALFSIDKEIMALKNQIIEIKRKDLESKKSNPTEKKRKEINERKDALHDDLRNLLSKVSTTQIEIDTLERRIIDGQNNVSLMNSKRTSLLEQLKGIDAEISNPVIEDECPTCHQKLPEERVEEILKEKVNALLTKRIELINQGKENTLRMNESIEQVKVNQEKLDALKVEIEQSKSALKILSTQIEEAQVELDKLSTNDDVEIVNPDIITLEEKIKQKEDEKTEIRSSILKREESIRSLIAEEQVKKENFLKVIENRKFYERTIEQIESVNENIKKASSELVAAEQKEDMVKLFVKTKLELLDSNVHKVFGDINFKLIEPQINGGYSPICKPYIKGSNTLWKSGSKSEQITTGVAICEKIKEHLDLPSFPYLFDEGGEVSTETFNTRFETESQLICVQVKDNISTPTVMKI